MPSSSDSGGSLADAAQLTLARDLLYSRRPLRQWVQGDVHVSAAHSRAIGYDELFFDLVIVATIAVFGDDLRERFTGWREVHRFVLLYGTVISIWRESTFLYNAVGTRRDLFEKASISSVIVCVAGIGLGASSAFRTSTRAVAGFAFTAHAILAVRILLSSLPGLYDARTANAAAMALAACPYLAAVFAPASAARALFWAAIGAQLLRSLLYSEFLMRLHARKSTVRIPAVDVHALAERYGLITLIVFGETFVSTLVEGNHVFQENEDRDPAIVLAVAAAVLIVYSVHGFYFDVDGRVSREDCHALRRNRISGTIWTLLHYPLHVGLILAESALGIMVEVVGEVEEVEEGAAEGAEAVMVFGVGYPTKNQVWLLCGSWALALTSLVLISLLHARKRQFRPSHLIALATRCVVAVLLLTAVPLASVDRLKALPLVYVVCGLLVGAFILEFTAITVDDHVRVKEAIPVGGQFDGDAGEAGAVDEEHASVLPTTGGKAEVEEDESHRRQHLHDRHGGPFSAGLHTAMSTAPQRGRELIHTRSPFRGFSLF